MKYSITLFFLFTLSFFCCKNNAQKTETTSEAKTEISKPKFIDLDVQQFDKMKVNEDVVILDVRRPDETAQGIVEGAIEINVLENDFDKEIKALDKSKTYLVYCKAGGRSVNACNKMSEHGFNKLYNLKGGYTAWSEVNK